MLDFFPSIESWRGLLADTSQSSFGSSGSPPLVAASSLGGASGGLDYPASGRGRRNRHAFLADTALTSSLPSYYDTSSDPHFRYRPESFRKSSSHPSRSPPIPDDALYLQSPTGSTVSLGKRQLPQVPLHRRSSRGDRVQMTLDLEERARHWKVSLHQRRSTEEITPMGMYSDSELSSQRPAYDRPSYAHPHRATMQRQRSSGGRVTRVEYEPSSGEQESGPERRRRESSAERRRREEEELHGGRTIAKSRYRQLSRTGGESGEESETSSVSKVSATSAFSTVSERPVKGSRTLR